MIEIKFFKDKNGYSDVLEYINHLRDTAESNKSNRIKYEKIFAYINLLSEKGVSIGMPYIKYLDNGIYELRPLDTRLTFFYYEKTENILF
jgi:phage-related protein